MVGFGGNFAYLPLLVANFNLIFMTNQIEMATAIATQVAHLIGLPAKDVLTTDEAAAYLGITKSYLYKLTCLNLIPYSKPMGKMCYFSRSELKQWALSNRQATTYELGQAAATLTQKGGVK